HRVRETLVGADRRAEHAALIGVGEGGPEHVADEADGDWGAREALGVEQIEEVAVAGALLADQARARHAHVVEEERPLPLGLVEGGVLYLLREARGVRVDDEQREARPLVAHLARGRGAGHEEHVLRLLDPRDEVLLPADAVAVAVAGGERLEAEAVRARVRLGDREAEAGGAARETREVAALLLRAAVPGGR